MSKEQFFNQKEGALEKESLQEEHLRLQQEVAELNASLNEQQKELRGKDAPTADFNAMRKLAEIKAKRLTEIEERLREQ